MVKNLKVGEIDFTRISRGTQFHFLWNISHLGEYSGEDFHFVDPEGKEFSFDDENIFKVTNVDKTLVASNYLILDLVRI